MKNIIDFQEYYTEEKGWSGAIEAAVQELSEGGGGILFVPAGKYETVSFRLYSNIILYLEAGAELCFIREEELYPVVRTVFEGKTAETRMPCIYAKDAENVVIAGMGTINGQGSYWWERKKTVTKGRPCLICMEACRRIKLLDVTLVNSPAWTIHPLYCEDVEIRGVTIRNPKDSPNTDGINPESCRNVRIMDCLVDVGDDCITLKAGTEETDKKAPCENITVSNCNLVHGHGGVVIGSEMSGGVSNVTISNCVFQDTDRGIRVKTRRGRGGAVEQVTANNLVMERVLCPFTFNMYYQCGAEGDAYKEKTAHTADVSTPVFRNIRIAGLQAVEVRAAAGFFYGLPEMPVENIVITDCTVAMAKGGEGGCAAMMEDAVPTQGKGIILRFARNITFRNLTVLECKGAPIDKDDTVENLTIDA